MQDLGIGGPGEKWRAQENGESEEMRNVYYVFFNFIILPSAIRRQLDFEGGGGGINSILNSPNYEVPVSIIGSF